MANERDGHWGVAWIPQPMTQAEAQVNSVSCAPAGNCAAGGSFTSLNSLNQEQAFVLSRRNLRWGRSQVPPGLAALNAGLHASITSLSCPSAGNCAAGGFYQTTVPDHTGGNPDQAFVVSETSGVWGTAQEVPGTAVLNATGLDAAVTSVSCPSAGNCAAGGFYTGPNDPAGPWHPIAFVVTETSGVWGTAQVPSAPAAASQATASKITSVSCPSPGNRGAGGYYQLGKHAAAFVVSEKNGTWGTAVLVVNGAADTSSVSCPSAANCGAGGSVAARGATFVAMQTNGHWGKGEQILGLARLGGKGAIESVSCPWAGNCAAAGSYTDRSGHTQAFVTSQTQ